METLSLILDFAGPALCIVGSVFLFYTIAVCFIVVLGLPIHTIGFYGKGE